MIIPTPVGRLDDVTDALRDGNDREALRLLETRAADLFRHGEALAARAAKARMDAQEIVEFMDRFNADPDFRGTSRRACGWGEP